MQDSVNMSENNTPPHVLKSLPWCFISNFLHCTSCSSTLLFSLCECRGPAGVPLPMDLSVAFSLCSQRTHGEIPSPTPPDMTQFRCLCKVSIKPSAAIFILQKFCNNLQLQFYCLRSDVGVSQVKSDDQTAEEIHFLNGMFYIKAFCDSCKNRSKTKHLVFLFMCI